MHPGRRAQSPPGVGTPLGAAGGGSASPPPPMRGGKTPGRGGVGPREGRAERGGGWPGAGDVGAGAGGEPVPSVTRCPPAAAPHPPGRDPAPRAAGWGLGTALHSEYLD